MEQDLTKGNLWKQIVVFSLPLIISNLLQVLFSMADIAAVGRFAGSIALEAVGSTTTLFTLFTVFLIGMAGNVNVLNGCSGRGTGKYYFPIYFCNIDFE